ncbi:hypothetical protein BJX70DRAFT_395081 [Aspergillus crustosus]
MESYKVHIGTTAGHPDSKSVCWFIGVGHKDSQKCDWFWSDGGFSYGSPYAHATRKNTHHQHADLKIYDLFAFGIMTLTEQELPLFADFFEKTQPGPSTYFVLRFLWKFVEAGLLKAHIVAGLVPLAYYSAAEWRDNDSGFHPLDQEFMKRRWASGWKRIAEGAARSDTGFTTEVSMRGFFGDLATVPACFWVSFVSRAIQNQL